MFLEVRQMTSLAEARGSTEQLASSSKEENEAAKKRKAKLAAKRKEKIIAKISQMQQNFIRDNAELFESSDADTSLTHGSSEMDIRYLTLYFMILYSLQKFCILLPILISDQKPSRSFMATGVTAVL
jgi:sugar phosphate permease